MPVQVSVYQAGQSFQCLSGTNSFSGTSYNTYGSNATLQFVQRLIGRMNENICSPGYIHDLQMTTELWSPSFYQFIFSLGNARYPCVVVLPG